MFYRIYIPNIGIVDRPSLPEGFDIAWTNTVYADGHREGVLYENRGHINYAIDEIIQRNGKLIK